MTTLTNRVISVHNKKTSMRLAKAEWGILDNICLYEKIKRRTLIEIINENKDPKLGLTPSVRLFSLIYLHLKSNKNYSNSAKIQKAISEMQK